MSEAMVLIATHKSKALIFEALLALRPTEERIAGSWGQICQIMN